MSVLPTGTVTFLFTDIEGSTRLLEANPAAYRAALARHDAILRRAVAAHGGAIFGNRGDGFGAAFASPADAVQAALTAQRSLWQEPWSETGPLRARMALHTGEVELQGDEYFGMPLHQCARIMDGAHGGQIVLSAATAALVGDALPADARLHDLGEHRLRDVARPQRLHQLVGDGLPIDFPPFRTGTAIPHNLPAQSTAFIGREHQVQAIQEVLLRPETRLVTLTGPGGAGKTRLALQVAAQVLDSFPDGVYFVPLASVTDPDLVPSAIARVLDVRESPGRPVLAALADALRRQQLLVLLDNFEQVIDAAAAIAALLGAAHRVKALVTSRAPLRLYGERSVAVPPLALPDRRASPTSAHLAQFEAVRLFVDRAQAAQLDFALSDENAADIAEICHRLDGLPLALELAAARIRSLPPGALLRRMERRLPLLTGGARDLPVRQRTLRDAISWSYDLLEPAEQTLFRRLAVFRGFTLEAAETVGGDPRSGATSVASPLSDLDVFEGVASLVDKSLLRQDEGVGGQPWYVMLETVREFALERLEESGEADAVHRRQAQAALELAERSESMLVGPEQATWFARLEQEHDNLRSALRWSQEHGPAESALRLGATLGALWRVRGHLSEGHDQLTRLLRLPATSAHPALRAKVLGRLGLLLLRQGDYPSARAVLDESRRIQRHLGDDRAMAETCVGLGWVASAEDDYAAARTALEEGLEIGRRVGDRRSVAHALNGLGWIATDQGEHAAARVLLEEALAVFRALADTSGIADCLIHLGWALQAQGKTLEARRLLGESLVIGWELRDRELFADALDTCATSLRAEGDITGAACLLAAAHAQREIVGVRVSPSNLAAFERDLASMRASLGDQAFAEAWADGRAMSPEQAIAYASARQHAEPPGAGGSGLEATSARDDASPLTRREQEVAALIARGLTNRQIAEALVITEGTAANHVVHILNKLSYGSRAQVAAWAVEHGLGTTPSQT
jgi:predicted ATPase/class 3 adenylate cyclase/DNA-binding CsgD family transcriptional regulator